MIIKVSILYNDDHTLRIHCWKLNQIWTQVMDTPLWDNNEPNSNVFGFEPHIFPLELFIQYDSRNYPCCTVNHPQAFPKFWANIHSWLTSLIKALYMLFSVLRHSLESLDRIRSKVRFACWSVRFYKYLTYIRFK